MADDREEQVRRRAYALWEQDGRPHGRDQDHWLQALDEALIPETEEASAKASDPLSMEPPVVPAAKPKARRKATPPA